jgi:predicted Zn-dependent protease
MKPVWLFLLLSLIFTGCQTAPGTGRSQLLMVSNSEVSTMASTEFAKMKKLPNDPRLEKIKKIGLAIVTVARKEDKNKILPPANKWEFAIIDDKSPNAFAMPGGKIGFNVGMFPYAPTDDDIAVILGHEVAHVLNQHSNERISQGLLVAAGAVIVDEATKNKSAHTRQAWMTGFGLGAQFGVLLPFSREHESEADHLGLIFMARAGYNPEVAPAFWGRFSKIAGAKPPEFFSTHPADETRIKQLNAWMSEAKAQIPKVPVPAQ